MGDTALLRLRGGVEGRRRNTSRGGRRSQGKGEDENVVLPALKRRRGEKTAVALVPFPPVLLLTTTLSAWIALSVHPAIREKQRPLLVAGGAIPATREKGIQAVLKAKFCMYAGVCGRRSRRIGVGERAARGVEAGEREGKEGRRKAVVETSFPSSCTAHSGRRRGGPASSSLALDERGAPRPSGGQGSFVSSSSFLVVLRRYATATSERAALRR